MKAFVTGGTGFIGSHLVDALLRDPQTSEVRCLVRGDLKWLRERGIRHVKGHLGDVAALSQGLDGADVLIHAAATLKARSDGEFDRNNVAATETLVRMARRAGVKRVVVISSQAASGPSSGVPKREADPMEPVSMYGRSKMRMERKLEELASDRDVEGMQITVVRPPAVYGPREEQIFSYFKMAKYRLSPIIGSGDHPRVSMVHVDDLVSGLMLAARFGDGGLDTFFLSGPQMVTWNEIRQATDQAFGRRSVPIRIPPGVVTRLAGWIEDAAGLWGGYPLFNRDKASELVREWTCDHEKAVRILGYSPTIGLQQGIRDTIEWYRRHYWL